MLSIWYGVYMIFYLVFRHRCFILMILCKLSSDHNYTCQMIHQSSSCFSWKSTDASLLQFFVRVSYGPVKYYSAFILYCFLLTSYYFITHHKTKNSYHDKNVIYAKYFHNYIFFVICICNNCFSTQQLHYMKKMREKS